MNRAFIGVVIAFALIGREANSLAVPEPTASTNAPALPAAQLQFDLGVKLMHERKWIAATQAFGRAVNTQTNFPQAYCNWGISLVQLGKQAMNAREQLQSFQAAADKFSRAAAQKPDDKLTYILWSETLLMIGDLPVESHTRLACYQGAVEKCRKAVELAPDDWEPYNKWAAILSTKLPDFAANDQARYQLYTEAAGLFAKAADRARFGSEVGPMYDNWAGALVHAAQVSPDSDEKQSLLRDAVGKFERAARAHPGAATTYAMWGNALIDLGKVTRLRGDLRDAIEKLNTSLALQPDDPAVLYSLARAYAQLDNPVMAVDSLRKCFEADTGQFYRQSASQDADFATLRGTPPFDELTGKAGQLNLPNHNPGLSDAPR